MNWSFVWTKSSNCFAIIIAKSTIEYTKKFCLKLISETFAKRFTYSVHKFTITSNKCINYWARKSNVTSNKTLCQIESWQSIRNEILRNCVRTAWCRTQRSWTPMHLRVSIPTFVNFYHKKLYSSDLALCKYLFYIILLYNENRTVFILTNHELFAKYQGK